ncbi:MAG: protease modulator HflC [Pseudomonadales bacterium]
MQAKGIGGIVVLLAIALLAAMSIFIVKETERAVLLRFGEIVRPDIQPGLHFKIPFVNSVRVFDARILTVDSRPERFLTLEKKAVIVDSYAKWRVGDTEGDVSKFYTATNGEESRARGLLAQRINTGLRNQFGERTIREVVSGERDVLMTELTASLNKIAKVEFGIEVVDIRVKRIDLPEEVSESVYQRMNTERERLARELRSEGNELAEGIRADADRRRTILKAEAYREAERIRGEGDAKSAAIYANAFNKDTEFYAFTRSLEAYRQSFSSKSDILLLEPKSDFFKYLNKPLGGSQAKK